MHLFSENGLTLGTVIVSGGTWIVTQFPILGQAGANLENGGIVVASIGLAALIVRTYGESNRVRSAERMQVLNHQHAERMAELDRVELKAKIAKLEAAAEYARRMCSKGICPWPNPDGSARCEDSEKPLSLEQAPIVVSLPTPPGKPAANA
jgi:hypothetical protein